MSLCQVSVQLVEASDHIMGSFDETLIQYTTRLLENRKVRYVALFCNALCLWRLYLGRVTFRFLTAKGMYAAPGVL